MMGWGGGWGGMGFGWIFMAGVLALLVAGVIVVARTLGRSGPGEGPRQATRTPLDILKERFARGEIDKEEFEERRRTLGE